MKELCDSEFSDRGNLCIILQCSIGKRRSQWPSGLRRGSAAARFLQMQAQILRGRGCLSLVSVVYCQRRVDHSSRRALPTVVCHYARSRNLKNQAALARAGLLRQRQRERVLVNMLGRYLSNAGSMGWVFTWRGYMTQLLLPVQKHLSLTLVTVSAPIVLAASVLGTGIFH